MRQPAVTRESIERLTRLSARPQAIARVSTLLANSATSAATIAHEIGKDEVLSAKVLRVVNSGFCGFRTTIGDLAQALVLLGRDAMQMLVMTAAVLDLTDSTRPFVAGLWRHSVGTGAAAQLLARRVGIPRVEEVAVAGLLHDIGKLIIFQTCPAGHEAVEQIVAGRGCLRIEAEREALGVTHADVGGWLLQRWSLPPRLVVPVICHNDFQNAREFRDRTAVVHLADIVCRAKGIGDAGDSGVPVIDPEAWSVLGLSLDDLEEIAATVDTDVTVEAA